MRLIKIKGKKGKVYRRYVKRSSLQGRKRRYIYDDKTKVWEKLEPDKTYMITDVHDKTRFMTGEQLRTYDRKRTRKGYRWERQVTQIREPARTKKIIPRYHILEMKARVYFKGKQHTITGYSQSPLRGEVKSLSDAKEEALYSARKALAFKTGEFSAYELPQSRFRIVKYSMKKIISTG